jgi:formylglycine-generating enzyme required for sulfatase activity
VFAELRVESSETWHAPGNTHWKGRHRMHRDLFRIVATFATLGIALLVIDAHVTNARGADDPVQNALKPAADSILNDLEEQRQATVAIGKFEGPPELKMDYGPWISKALAGILNGLKPGVVDPKSTFTIRGQYDLVQAEEAAEEGDDTTKPKSDHVMVRVTLDLFDANGQKLNRHKLSIRTRKSVMTDKPSLTEKPPVLEKKEVMTGKKPVVPDPTPVPVPTPVPMVPERPKKLTSPFDDSEARASQAAWSRFLGTPVIETNSVGMKLVLVPPGTFQIGDSLRRSNAIKAQPATVETPIYVGMTEVTQGDWCSVMPSRPWEMHGVESDDALPAVYISWDAANEFCSKLTALDQKARPAMERMKYRLPTECEWEWSCRAGTVGQFSCDEADLELFAFFKGDPGVIHPVRRKRPNPFGLFDVHGNVAEWCGEVFPGETPDPDRKVRRSGSANQADRHVASYARDHASKPSVEIGFRIVGTR